LLDSPNYRDRFLDEIYELESFLRMRLYELKQLETSSDIMFSLMDNIATHDAESIRKILRNLCKGYEKQHHIKIKQCASLISAYCR